MTTFEIAESPAYSVLVPGAAGPITRAEVYDRENDVALVIEVPETELDRVEVQIVGDTLWVQALSSSLGERLSPSLTQAYVDGGFPLPPTVDLNKVDYRYRDGWLTLVFSKRDSIEVGRISSDFIRPEQLPDFALDESRLDLLGDETSAARVVEELDLSEYELRSLLMAEELSPDELATISELLEAASRRRLATQALNASIPSPVAAVEAAGY